MHPFISIGSINIAVYGLCIVIGVGVGILAAVIRASAFNIERQDVFFSLLYAVIGLICGGKILYIVVNMKDVIFLLRAYGFESILHGGFIYYGGVGGAVLAVLIYGRQYKIPRAPLVSLLFLAAPLVHAFGRMGCFFAGCCYGIPWNGWCSIFLHGKQRLPVQLIEVIYNLIIFVVLFILSCRKKYKIYIPEIYLCSYSLFRFIIEFYRADSERGFLFFLSTSQWISLLIIAAVFVYHVSSRIRKTAE